MIRSKLFLVILIGHIISFSQFSYSKVVSRETYDYPEIDSITASTTLAFLKPTAKPTYKQDSKYKIERRELPKIGNRSELPFGFYRHKDILAPVVFIIPGLGGSPYTKASQFLGEKIFEQGYHVILLPSPFSWHFALGASRDGIVGISQKDSEDLYYAMLHIKELVTRKYSMQTHSVGVLGYSLGALHSAYIEKIDQKEKLLNLKTVLAINPPIDLFFGLRKLDEFNSETLITSGAKKVAIQKVYNVFMDFSDNSSNVNPLEVSQKVLNSNLFSIEELKYIIGKGYRDSLTDVIYASQQVKDLGVLPTSNIRDRRRHQEASAYSFSDYISKFICRYLEQTTTGSCQIKEFNESNGLSFLHESLSQTEHFHIMHNADDFLLKEGDAQKLNSIYGKRATIYPKGGHLGNLWHPINLNDIFKTFELDLRTNNR